MRADENRKQNNAQKEIISLLTREPPHQDKGRVFKGGDLDLDRLGPQIYLPTSLWS